MLTLHRERRTVPGLKQDQLTLSGHGKQAGKGSQTQRWRACAAHRGVREGRKKHDPREHYSADSAGQWCPRKAKSLPMRLSGEADRGVAVNSRQGHKYICADS